MITISCPKCKTRYEVNENVIGQKARCFSCGNVFLAYEAEEEDIINLIPKNSVNQTKTESDVPPRFLDSIKLAEGVEFQKAFHEKKLIILGVGIAAIIFIVASIFFPPIAFTGIIVIPYVLIKYIKKGEKDFKKWNSARIGAEDNSDLFNTANRLSNKGNSYAQNYIGVCYAIGRGGVKDPVEAVKWFKKAEQGMCYAASNNIGRCYYLGEGMRQKYARSVSYFKYARNLPEGQYNLGVCYYLGKGVHKDCSEAAHLFQLAANRGLAEAQYNLGVCLYNGDGVSKNVSEALYWWRKAAEQGLGIAEEAINR